MTRRLKFHEQRLLKKVDFFQWNRDGNLRESKVMRRYHIQRREDYVKLNKICGFVTKLANELGLLPAEDPCRERLSGALFRKLFDIGVVIDERPDRLPLAEIPSVVTVASLARRRLAVVMVSKLKMSENLREASTLIEHGHVRIGPDIVRDPGVLLTRIMEDFVTWSDGSKIRRKIDEYYGQADDFDDI